MALNMVSNYAANVAHRNLAATDMQATASLAKLSSGTRVVSAKDDAASMAIGSRLNAEIQALRQATVNAGQAAAMMQIADGAMARTSDILTRMKSLAVQAGSDQLGDVERGMLQTEYAQLIEEIDRIAQATTFNGKTLIAGSAATAIDTIGADLTAADGFARFDFGPGVGAASFTVDYTTADNVLTVTNTTTGESQGIVLPTPDPIAANETETVNFTQLGVKITLNAAFNKLADSGAGNVIDTMVDPNANTSFDFKIGTGTTANVDTLTITIGAATTNALGLDTTSIATGTGANLALDAINLAIDALNTSRAGIGASQNRLEFASSNLASTIENQESARSNLLDLDVAAEMTTFTSKQILMQAGVSMLAQANQMPQNLLKLLG
ncbi:MAG: flagellin [Alphaproteobacteria bacterium]